MPIKSHRQSIEMLNSKKILKGAGALLGTVSCSFLQKRDHEFVEQGGIRERMTAARLDHRGTQNRIIEAQAHEIEQLKAQVVSLQQELALLRKQDRPPE